MNPHLIASSLSTSVDAHMRRIKYKFDCASIIEYNTISIGLLKIEKKRDSIKLIQIQIDPLYQGQGMGKKIVKHVIDGAISEGKSVILDVLKSNKAQKLYLNLGFEIKAENEYSYRMKYSDNG